MAITPVSFFSSSALLQSSVSLINAVVHECPLRKPDILDESVGAERHTADQTLLFHIVWRLQEGHWLVGNWFCWLLHPYRTSCVVYSYRESADLLAVSTSVPFCTCLHISPQRSQELPSHILIYIIYRQVVTMLTQILAYLELITGMTVIEFSDFIFNNTWKDSRFRNQTIQNIRRVTIRPIPIAHWTI